jgi:hypothetical protein
MNKFDFRTFVNELNDAAHSHPIGALQEIRAELHGKQKAGHKIFQKIKDDWSFHHGGRRELQFNVGIDGLDDELFRSGVAFSFEPSRSYPSIDFLIDKAKLFNDFLRLYPDLYSDMRMWHWRRKKRSSESVPGVIPPELAEKGVFIFLGNARPFSELNHDEVLEDMDRLLPLYRYVESNGREQQLPSISDKTFVFRSGRNSKLTRTKASYARRELDVKLRHNELQEALERQLIAKYGSENVRHEVPAGNGNCIDLVVRREEGYWFYEIKAFPYPRACIREAVGQLLEYSFWPGSQVASRLIIVGEAAPDQDALDFCRLLKQRFQLPIEYEQIVI